MQLLELAKRIEEGLARKRKINWPGACPGLVQNLVNVMLDFPEQPNNVTLTIETPRLYKKVVLVSGGMDSTIMWWLHREEKDKLALFVDLGLSYCKKEKSSLIKTKITPLQVVEYPLRQISWKHIIPTRNFLLIALAQQHVKHGGEIWLGAVQGESSERAGDKSEAFFRLCERFIRFTTGKRIKIRTLKNKTKNDWLKKYLRATSDRSIFNTVTCYSGSAKGCGKCQACVRKWIALKYCKVEPTKYFQKDPGKAGQEHIKKYKKVLAKALANRDFSHYSRRRCQQDLRILSL